MPRIVPHPARLAAVFCLPVVLCACAMQAPAQLEPQRPKAESRPDAQDAHQAPGAALPEIDIPYQKYRLANGLTVIVHEDHKAPLVALNVWYHVGSKDEPAGRHGFAHLFEHLMFNGSQHYDDEYFRALEPAGATDMNGTTNTDRTNYFETVPTSALDLALWLESDRMGYLTGAISQAKLDEQRGVVLNEKRQDENQPYGKVDEVLARATYPAGHPYSWTTIGSEDDLNRATVADVKAWFKSYYGPNNAVLVIAGDVEPAALKAKVEQYFGELPPGPPVPHLRAWPAPLDSDKRMSLVDRVPLPRLYLAWNVPGDGERDAVLLQLFAELLSSGKDGRLYERLVYQDQSAATVSAGVDANEIGGQFQIVATARPGGDLVAIERATREELERLLQDGPTAAELARVQAADYAGAVRSLDKVGGFSGKAGLLAANEVFHADPAHYQLELDWQRKATPAEVREAARRWLTRGAFTLQVASQEPLSAARAGADRSTPPAQGVPPALKLPPLQHAILSNGLQLVLLERHNVPAVELQMLFDAGRAADAGGKSGTAALALEMLDEGAGNLSERDIARRQAELGATLAAGTSRDVSSVSLSAIKPKLAESLDLYATVLTQPGFPQAEIERVKQRLLAAIIKEKSQPFGLARRVLSRQLYGEGHPYAYAGLGLERDVAAIARDDLVAFQKRWMRPDLATLVIVGDTTLAEIQPLLEARFGGWHAPAEAAPVKNIAALPPPAAPRPGARVFLIDKPDAQQSLVLAANLAPQASDPDDEAMQTVNTALGGMFISRLNLNLREDKHWTYGASSFIAAARGPQIFGAYADIERDHTADAAREMQKELDGIAGSRPLSAKEIEAAKKAQVLALPGEFESAPGVVGAAAHIVEFGLPDRYWQDYVPRVEGLSAAQLQTAAGKLVKPGALTWVVVGDLSRIEPAMRRLKLGEVKVLDGDGKVLR